MDGVPTRGVPSGRSGPAHRLGLRERRLVPEDFRDGLGREHALGPLLQLSFAGTLNASLDLRRNRPETTKEERDAHDARVRSERMSKFLMGADL